MKYILIWIPLLFFSCNDDNETCQQCKIVLNLLESNTPVSTENRLICGTDSELEMILSAVDTINIEGILYKSNTICD